MKNYRPLIATAAVMLLLICVPLLTPTKSIANAGNGSTEALFAETPNITVVDQFGIPVPNVKLNVLFEADGESRNIEVSTPQTGFVPITGKSGTYTFTVKSVPDGYKMTDQKIIQTYQDGSAYTGKQITVYRNDDNNPFTSGVSSTTLNVDSGNFSYNPTLNFSANLVLEFKTYLKDIVKEVLKELDEEEKQAAPTPSDNFWSSDNSSVPSPTPTPVPSVPSPEEQDFDTICAIVASEGGTSYDSAMGVISCVMNRVDAGYGSDAISVLTAPGQFASYIDGSYVQYTNGKYPDSVKHAVIDCMKNGIRSHNFLNYRTYETSGSVNIGGNWYF
ncbi:hypothetical protein [Eubacterium callanderi]|uniref:hypothetical protein n=1 Tax=Eubacterium callanderi TaxID=53442 RepID=UPI00204C52D9|nr:MAG TPA: Spore cortex-lytic enzyme, lytic transglycosylase [Caudoviricetes sp.]